MRAIVFMVACICIGTYQQQVRHTEGQRRDRSIEDRELPAINFPHANPRVQSGCLKFKITPLKALARLLQVFDSTAVFIHCGPAALCTSNPTLLGSHSVLLDRWNHYSFHVPVDSVGSSKAADDLDRVVSEARSRSCELFMLAAEGNSASDVVPGGNDGGSRQVLMTGGCGYIGSHTIVTLLEMGYDVTVVDNLANSRPESLQRVVDIVGCSPERVRFFEVDLCNHEELEAMFKKSPQFCACIHFAGLKAVGESTSLPLLYYENNLGGTTNLLKLMDKYKCNNIIFSSSATVYGSEAVPPLTEASPVGSGITNPYGRTKYMIEEILRDFKKSKSLKKDEADNWGIVVLRYFNPVGAHPSGSIGEDPNGIPNNLMPYVAQVAVGRREKLTIFGDDYATPDGTGVRDYIHVVDLAEGHAAALTYLEKKGAGFYCFNLGTGRGYSVLEMVKAMSKACGHEINYDIGPRRPGDIAEVYADTTFAEKELGWKASRTQEDMCNDIWRWQSKNPNGFSSAS